MTKRKFHEVDFDYFNEDYEDESVEDEYPLPDKYYFEDSDKEENYEQSSAVTSLQNICAAKICSMFWMKTQVRQQIISVYRTGKKSKKKYLSYEWYDIDIFVRNQIKQLLLPEKILLRLLKKSSHIRKSIINWINISFNPFFDCWQIPRYTFACLIKYLSWTVRGTIDLAITAQKIINESLLNDYYKYRLACMFCLKKEIFRMASRIINIRFLSRLLVDREMSPGIYFWTIIFICCDSDLYDKYRAYLNLDDSRLKQLRETVEELKIILTDDFKY